MTLDRGKDNSNINIWIRIKINKPIINQYRGQDQLLLGSVWSHKKSRECKMHHDEKSHRVGEEKKNNWNYIKYYLQIATVTQ